MICGVQGWVIESITFLLGFSSPTLEKSSCHTEKALKQPLKIAHPKQKLGLPTASTSLPAMSGGPSRRASSLSRVFRGLQASLTDVFELQGKPQAWTPATLSLNSWLPATTEGSVYRCRILHQQRQLHTGFGTWIQVVAIWKTRNCGSGFGTRLLVRLEENLGKCWKNSNSLCRD